ncbi:hypothetical protein AOLI_G00066130 [Acnodon oligacanthus]
MIIVGLSLPESHTCWALARLNCMLGKLHLWHRAVSEASLSHQQRDKMAWKDISISFGHLRPSLCPISFSICSSPAIHFYLGPVSWSSCALSNSRMFQSSQIAVPSSLEPGSNHGDQLRL